MNQSTTPAYETDFYAWTQLQANLLRDEEFEELDLPNLIEEIEAMARRERRELISRLTLLISHLLKWQIQSDLRSRSWQNSIHVQRLEIKILLEDSPSLRAAIDEYVASAYPRARSAAITETGLLHPRFPEHCPYTPEQLLNEDFLPEE